jgi:hypothetical protein
MNVLCLGEDVLQDNQRKEIELNVFVLWLVLVKVPSLGIFLYNPDVRQVILAKIE